MASTNGTRWTGEDFVARQTMVHNQLERRGITAPRVLEAMRQVPRHLFVPPEWRSEAYSDRPLPIGAGQTISQPYMVAIMLQELALRSNARVLEVGTGSGYQAAVLSRLAAQVWSLEYFAPLADEARQVLQRLHCHNVQIIVRDGGLGLPEHAPYDGIVVAAAASRPPPLLLAQLAEGGRLVIPVGTESNQELFVITKQTGGYHEQRRVHCRFVPLLGEEGWHTP
jgi:protein-L-isoaspartate(D-aspartate) O-methyltransferase